MNGLEEIKKIIKEFNNEKQQKQQEIAKIEAQRTLLAYERNRIKQVSKNIENSYGVTARPEIAELANNITQLGNLSQELQNKLDCKFIQLKNTVTNTINTLLAEKEEKINEVENQKQEIQGQILAQEARNQRYDLQKKEFFVKFGRLPELSESAQQEEINNQKKYNENKNKIAQIELDMQKIKSEIEELKARKKDIQNGNLSNFINREEIVKISTDEEPKVIEEVVQQLKSIEESTDVETFKPIQEIKLEDVQLEDIQIEETKPILEMEIAETQELGEITIEENTEKEVNTINENKQEKIEPITEIQELEIDIPEEINVVEEKFETNKEIETVEEKFEETEDDISAKFDFIKEMIANIREKANSIQVEEPLEEKEITPVQEIQTEVEKPIEEEIITLEEDKTENIPSTFGRKVSMLSIIAKFEENNIVYKIEINDGNSIKIYPFQKSKEVIKSKEYKNNIRETLINYAISEYKHLDKKVIKKIDPIICELLSEFADEYGYNADELIYNYAMTFSKSEEVDSSEIPIITYNFPYLKQSKIFKKEKEMLLKICKNAKHNEKIEIIESTTGIGKMKYIVKRMFSSNNVNALPEGKY